MEYHAIFVPFLPENTEEKFVFESKKEALETFKSYKDARLKSFKSKNEATRFSRNGPNSSSIGESTLGAASLKSPSSKPSLEKSLFVAPKSQDLVKFRKEIETNNLQSVYETIWNNPRYLVSSGDTPSILKEGPRYNSLHIATIHKNAKMAKLILQTIEQTQFVELLHGCKNDATSEEVSQILLESYLNTPDKSRNETPLHFASKLGAVEVIEVLILYPLCKMKKNCEGLYPKDIICSRVPNSPPELKAQIEELLKERFFVPVMRSNDTTVSPMIGEPFTPNNMPKRQPGDLLSPTMEIKAYAGPMDKSQAQTFQKRWKTPPRLVPSQNNSQNISFSPRNSNPSTPHQSPRHGKSSSEFFANFTASTPKSVFKKKLFDGKYSEDGGDSDTNGNHIVENEDVAIAVNSVKEKGLGDGFKEFEDAELERIESFPTKLPNFVPDLDVNKNNKSRNDSLWNNIGSPQARTSIAMCFLDESGSVFNSSNIEDSKSYQEKHIRLTDMEKGLEIIGRELAADQKVGWKEYWEFLGTFVDINSDDGLRRFENFLKFKEKTLEMNERNHTENAKEKTMEKNKVKESSANDTLQSICAGLYSLDLNEEISEKNHKPDSKLLASPTAAFSAFSLINDFMYNNQNGENPDLLQNEHIDPYQCIEKSCKIYANRLIKTLANKQIQDQHVYEKSLLAEIKKLNTLIDSYKRDQRFQNINYQKIHSRYCYLFTWYLKQNNIEVEYLRNHTTLLSKVYALSSQYSKNYYDKSSHSDVQKCHAICLSSFIVNYIEKQAKLLDPDEVEAEDSCIAAWNFPEIAECRCVLDNALNCFGTSLKSRQTYRREIRKKLHLEGDKLNFSKKLDIWAPRLNYQNSDDEDDDANDTFVSCSDSDSDNDEYFTPPESPGDLIEDDFSFCSESLEEPKDFKLFIQGDDPTKADMDVFNALGNEKSINETLYPLVKSWYVTIKSIKIKSQEASTNSRFRLFTPKLKLKY